MRLCRSRVMGNAGKSTCRNETGGPGQGSGQAWVGLTGPGPLDVGAVTHPSSLWFGMMWRVGVN